MWRGGEKRRLQERPIHVEMQKAQVVWLYSFRSASKPRTTHGKVRAQLKKPFEELTSRLLEEGESIRTGP